MNDDEYAALLQALRAQTRDNGRADLDDVLVSSRLIDAPTVQDGVVGYLSGLRDDLRLRSTRAMNEILANLSDIPTDQGGFVEGIVLDVTDQDRAAFGISEVDLTDSSEYDEAIREIDELIAQIREDDGS